MKTKKSEFKDAGIKKNNKQKQQSRSKIITILITIIVLIIFGIISTLILTQEIKVLSREIEVEEFTNQYIVLEKVKSELKNVDDLTTIGDQEIKKIFDQIEGIRQYPENVKDFPIVITVDNYNVKIGEDKENISAEKIETPSDGTITKATSVGLLAGNSSFYVIVFLLISFAIYKALQIKDKRMVICVLLVSGFLSGLNALGINTVYKDVGIDFLIYKFIQYLILLYALIMLLFNWLKNRQNNKNKKKLKEFSFFTNNKRSIFLLALIIFGLWLPYLLRHYPGIIGVDTLYQIKQAVGVLGLTSAHPVLHTMMISGCLNIGINIFSDINVGVAIYSILQLILMAFVVSYFIYFLAKKGVSPIIRAIVGVFFAINPIFPLFGISLIKDTVFAVMILLDLILILDFVTNKDKFLHSKSKIIMSAICIILTCLIRNSGMYIFILLVPAVYIFVRKYYIKITAFFILTFMISGFANGPLLEMLKIPKTADVEMILSIPLQGIARTVKYNESALSQEQKDEISKYLDYEKIAKLYNENLSDPMKDIFDRKYFTEHKKEFFELYLKIFIENPTICVQAVLSNTSGYWYPEKIKLLFVRDVCTNNLGIEKQPIIENEVLDKIDSISEDRTTPFGLMFFSIGACIWVLVITLTYLIYRKKYNLCILFLPIICLYLILIAGPSNTEMRYAFPIYICAPLLIISAICDFDKRKVKFNIANKKSEKYKGNKISNSKKIK